VATDSLTCRCWTKSGVSDQRKAPTGISLYDRQSAFSSLRKAFPGTKCPGENMAYPHWSLFEVIDEELQAFSRQVEFAKDNLATYSVTLLRLYLSICSEVDVVAKMLCQRIGAKLPKQPNMGYYRRNLKTKYPNLSGVKITIRHMALSILPWEAWDQDKNPDWWEKHQDVKHRRDQHFADANLENVLHAAAGLLVFLVYWHQPELWALKITPALDVFDIEGINRVLAFIPSYELKDFGKRP